MSKQENAVRDHVLYVLKGGGAHLGFEQAIADVPVEMRGANAPGVGHTLWRLLEHLRICQWDILEFSRDPNHISPEFPDGLWPAEDAPPIASAWEHSIASFLDDRQAMIDLVASSTTDLFAEIPHGDGQTILREALLVADHNAYHIGQIVFLRRCLGIWDD
ncbi:MAG TPA: ABC transporter [Planctomycetaceae bacterium]|nr:ABC transporter [Planctomycetaceae bacterium]